MLIIQKMNIYQSFTKTIIICLFFSLTEALDICTNNKCKNDAQCLPSDNGLYKCHCNSSYRGIYCEEKLNCIDHQCQNGATCVNLKNEYKCLCLNGWYGEYCQFNADDCALKPCKNNGVCKDLENHKYFCECTSNYIGMHCEYKNPCAEANPCGINGKCVNDNIGGYKCHCDKGFIGSACSIDVNECEQFSGQLCENGGRCINTVGSYRCECAKGYSGERCANDIVDCKNSTCKNGGTCLDKIGHYKCVCTENFRGNNCEIPIPICETKPCKNNGLCQSVPDDFYCDCPKQWMGKRCETPFDLCSNNPCVNDGLCEINDLGSLECICKEGYNGKLCENNINDCIGINCQNKGQCKDLINSWRCSCSPGFMGRYCEINIDECESRPCHNNAICVDLINDYKCNCPQGLEGKNCEINIDDCVNNPCTNGGRCEDRVGGFTCHCSDGFAGLHCEIKPNICAQLLPCKNEGVCHNDQSSFEGYICICPKGITSKDCSTEDTRCMTLTCANGGKCTTEDAKERCICSPGYAGIYCEIEIDECQKNPCQNRGTCQDLMNDYLCHCPLGYKGKNCEIDIDECENNPCGQNGECIDEINSFRCKCFLSYSGPTCSNKLDICKSNLCANDAICVPKMDYKSYYCNCSTAFGRFTGIFCNEDINECLIKRKDLVSYKLIKSEAIETFDGPCFNKGECINTIGSFICKCESGFEGKQCEINVNDCMDYPCKNGAVCTDLVNGYECHCKAGFTGVNCEIEINECLNSPCQNGAQCKDYINDYQCICVLGYSGKNCEINDNDCNEQSCLGHGDCIDKINNFDCHCFKGYKGKNCEQLELPCDSIQCFNNGSCVNIYTNSKEPDYLCSCRLGYSGPKCEIKMDWCRGSPCKNDGICYSDGNGFKCKCTERYIGERCEIQKNETCELWAQRQFNNQSLTMNICLNKGYCFNQAAIGGFKCSCPSGYKGTFCEDNIDECANQTCLNGGECKDGIGMYSCKCSMGFQGVNCESNINYCSSDLCNQGKCVNQLNNFTCICPKGVSGRYCDVIKDNCKKNKCQNGGECKNLLGDINCQCKKGFTGKFCEIDLNECRYKINGDLIDQNENPYGPCSPFGTITCLDKPGGFQCICRSDFEGIYCQTRIDTCEQIKSFGRLPCYNSGICVNQNDRINSSTKGYRCICPTGYGGDRCQLYNVKCQYNLCLNGGVCRPINVGEKLSFVCDCQNGVGGLFCEKDFINECESATCYNKGRCLDGFGKAICRCSEGFCGEKCEIRNINSCNSSSIEPVLSYTDEVKQCNMHRCNTKFNNKRCDLECNNLACGFDSGECLHKVPRNVGGKSVTLATPWSNCTIIQSKNIPCHHWFMNGRCDPQCNTETCLFDGWDCEKSINQCPKKDFCDSHFGDKECQPECNTIECDFDGGDCLNTDNSTISGAIVIVLPIPITAFVNVWQYRLLQSLTHLLHSIVRVKKQESGRPMIYPIRVFVENFIDDNIVRQKRSVLLDGSIGKAGTKVYLEIDNSVCRNSNKMCFDNSKPAAEFISAALHSRLYQPPIPILSVQSDSSSRVPLYPPHINKFIYVILIMTCLIILGILIGVLYGFMQNKSKSDQSKTKKAETWFPEGMKCLSQSSSNFYPRRLSNSTRKRNQNAFKGINLNSELGNLSQLTTKSKISTTDSIDDSTSNSLTSTRVTSYDLNVNENSNETSNISDNCMLLSNTDLSYNFPPEKRLKLQMDTKSCSSEQPNLENWCFNALVNLLVSGNGLGELTLSESRNKQIILEKIFDIAVKNQSYYGSSIHDEVPNKKELTNNSLTRIITSRIPDSGETLLHLAARYNRKEVVKFLVEGGSDPNKVEYSGRSSLLVAIDAGALEVTFYLLKQQDFPIDIHQKGPGGVTCLIQAVKGAHLEIVQMLLQHTQPEECDPNVADDYGRTALHWASATNEIEVVQLLLSYGLNRDAQDNQEMTPFYLACREGSFDICKLLITNGANIDMRDHLDRLPRDIAKSSNFNNIVALIDEYIIFTKGSQQQGPMVWGQYSYYSNNYYCPSNSIELKSALNSSPYSLNPTPYCFLPNPLDNDAKCSTFYNSSIAPTAQTTRPYYGGDPINYSVKINESLENSGSSQNTVESRNIEGISEKYLKSPYFFKDKGNYFDYCTASNVHIISNIKNGVPISNRILPSRGYPSNNNVTSSTSVPGITPSPDSDSPGHWSTSSPSLSPRSKNQQHLTKYLSQKIPIVQKMKPSVLHYHPTNDNEDQIHQNC